MFLSALDIFKVGVGPSSSHTVGPMVAAGRFLDALRSGKDRIPGSGAAARLGCRLHGSLAFTGKGHATDRAVTLGLLGFAPADFDAAAAAAALERLQATGRLRSEGLPELGYVPERDLVFDYGPALPGHANGLVLSARVGPDRSRRPGPAQARSRARAVPPVAAGRSPADAPVPPPRRMRRSPRGRSRGGRALPPGRSRGPCR